MSKSAATIPSTCTFLLKESEAPEGKSHEYGGTCKLGTFALNSILIQYT